VSVGSTRPGGSEAPAADRFRRQDAEQVEVGRFFVLEEAHLQPCVVSPAEHLEAAVGLDQAHRTRHLLIDGVGGPRDGGQGEQVGEDRPGRYAALAPGASARRRGRFGLGAGFALRAGPWLRWALGAGRAFGPGLRARSALGPGLRARSALGPRLGPGIARRPGPRTRIGPGIGYRRRLRPRLGRGRPVPGCHPVRDTGRVSRAAIPCRPSAKRCRPTAIWRCPSAKRPRPTAIRRRTSTVLTLPGLTGYGSCSRRLSSGHVFRIRPDLRPGSVPPGGLRPGARRREHGRGQRKVHPLFDEAGHLLPGDHDLEDFPVDLPVAELRGPRGVPAQVGDVQPVAKVVQDQAGLLSVVADRPR
jgi:hypothetical protein